MKISRCELYAVTHKTAPYSYRSPEVYEVYIVFFKVPHSFFFTNWHFFSIIVKMKMQSSDQQKSAFLSEIINCLFKNVTQIFMYVYNAYFFEGTFLVYWSHSELFMGCFLRTLKLSVIYVLRFWRPCEMFNYLL